MRSCATCKTIAARVSEQTERVDRAITGTIDRVDETTERVRDSVHDKVAQATASFGATRGDHVIADDEPTPKPIAHGASL